MVYVQDSNLLYAIQDKGNKPVLSVFSLDGTLKNTLKFDHIQNNDWEELANDASYNLYIGDFGNNKNDRKNLAIHKILHKDLQSNQRIDIAQTTTFHYPEQTSYPPSKRELKYDCEAFIATDEYFYLFTKNRSKGFDGSFFVYRVPNRPGHFLAEKTATLISCQKYQDCAITGAALQHQSEKIVLTTHSKIFVLKFRADGRFSQDSLKMIDLQHSSQKEAVTFKNNTTLYLSDEKEKGAAIGGHLYEYSLSKNDNLNQN